MTKYIIEIGTKAIAKYGDTIIIAMTVPIASNKHEK